MTTHLIIPDIHAHPEHSNERADWLANLINDTRPDVVVNIGDSADMSSLSSYDRGKRSFYGKSYAKDLEAHQDFQERMWGPVRARKKKLPYRVVLEGNHEHRIEKALDMSPELQGTIGFQDFLFDEYYDEVIRYDGNTPGATTIDGVTYAHYFTSGNMGRAIGNEHSAYSLLTKKFVSCTQGHSHTLDFCTRVRQDKVRIMGLVAGSYFDYQSDWAGTSQTNWWKGVIIKHNVNNGTYDPEFISLEQLRKAYAG
jgi:3',5'-cyclic AMP phosphodiesterase CpdA